MKSWQVKILYSRPYYGTGYVLVQRKNGPRPVARGAEEERSRSDWERRQGRSPTINSDSVASSLAASVSEPISFHAQGLERRRHRFYAYLWANVGWTLHVSPDLSLELVPNYIPEDHWNIAVAMSQRTRRLQEARRRGSGTGYFDCRRNCCPHPWPVTMCRIMPPVAGIGSRRAQGRRGRSDPARGRGPWPRATNAENPNLQAGVFRAGQDPLGRGSLVVGLDQNTTSPSRRRTPSQPASITRSPALLAPINWASGFGSIGLCPHLILIRQSSQPRGSAT